MNAPETRLQQFHLTEKLARLVNVNPRAEIHGDERVPACDLRVSVELPNSALEMFDAALPKALFMPDPTEPDILDMGHLDTVKFPKLAPLKWKHEIIGAKVHIGYGIDTTSGVDLDLCDVDKFSVECRNGGTVAIDFRIVCKPDADDLGKLCTMIGGALVLTVTPPVGEPDGLKGQDEE